MANKLISQSNATVVANYWFSNYLDDHIHNNQDILNLSKAIGIERKSIIAYKLCQRSPKLEVVAKVLAYYGDTMAKIPLTWPIALKERTAEDVNGN